MVEFKEVEVDEASTKMSKGRRSTYTSASGTEIKFPAHLRSLSNVYTYLDPDRGVRFSSSSTLVESAPEKGTWLATQIEAGIIGE